MDPVPPITGTPRRKCSFNQLITDLAHDPIPIRHEGKSCAPNTFAAKPITTTTAHRQRQLQPAIGEPRRRRPTVLGAAFAGGDAVESDGREHDAEPGREGQFGVELLQALQHLAADVAGTDLRGDHDDAEGHHDHLVEAEQDRLAAPAAAAPCRAVAVPVEPNDRPTSVDTTGT